MNDEIDRKYEHVNANDRITAEQMKLYVRGLLPEGERIQVEQQIEASDACLELFIAAVESEGADAAQTVQNPKMLLPDMELLEERVVSQLMAEQQQQKLDRADGIRSVPTIVEQEKSFRRSSWMQHPATHYTVAASITLLLLGSGTFVSFSQKLAQLDLDANAHKSIPPISAPADVQTESWSDKIVDQTGSWLDGLQAIRFK